MPDGHALRRIDWPGDNTSPRGSILFLPGRGDHYEKYLESLEEWHRDGWRVSAFDWRGQAGSGRLTDHPDTGHIEDFSIWVDDLAALWEAWTKETRAPHVLIAHSMGGHIVMRALVEHRIAPDAVALSAPMLGMKGPPLPLGFLHNAVKMMRAMGDPERHAWKVSEKPGQKPYMRAGLLTHDEERYEDELWWREERPFVEMGPASWHWVERAYASWRLLEEPGGMEQVETPVLIFSTTSDKLVSHFANVNAIERLPNGEMLEFGEEAHHEILREVDEVRGRAMDGIAEFLNRVAPQHSK